MEWQYPGPNTAGYVTALNGYFVWNTRLGIGGSPELSLDIKNGFAVFSNNDTNNTTKIARLMGRSYSNSEEDIVMINLATYSSTNVLSIGGGSSTDNGATQINFKTSTGVTQVNPDTRMSIDSSGNVGIGSTTPQGNFQISPAETHGGYITKIYAATSGTLTGATDTIDLSIPSGWVVTGCQLHVKTAVTDSVGDDTWSSELNDGAQEEIIAVGSAASQNTNVNHFGHADAGYGGTLTDATTNILLTPNGGNFTAGEIEGHCMARGFDSWDNE